MKKKIIAICLVCAVLFGILPMGVIPAIADGVPTGTLHAYPEFDSRIERDYLYSVSVTDQNGTTVLPVYNHVEDSRTTRNTVDISADEYRRFSTFAFEGTVIVNIKVNRDFTSYSVIPSAKGIPSTFDSSTGTIRVTLDEPIYFMIRLDGMDSTNIALLADAPENEAEIPEPGANTYVYTNSWNEVDNGILKLKNDHSVVYIAPGAVLNARIEVTADNCKIIGRGAIVDPYSDIFGYDEIDAGRGNSLVFVQDADDTIIDGVHLLNAHAYNLEVQGKWGESYAERTSITNVKILSSQMSSDGLMLNYYIDDAVAERCFVYCGDNGLNYEDNATFRDILVGTTCNAVFPQTDVTDSHLENIYVFRSEDNIINPEYAGSDKINGTLIHNHTITNLYAQDVTSTSAFLYVESTTLRVNEEGSGTEITNVCLPAIAGINSRFYINDYEIGMGDHKITLKNVYIDGTRISSITPYTSGNKKHGYARSGSWGYISYPKDQTFTYSTAAENEGFSAATKTAHSVTVNYENDCNVFVGNYQVNFADPVQIIGSVPYLPYREIKAHLGVGASTNVQVINGVEYIAYTELTASGAKMANAASFSGNRLSITPYNTGDNLLVSDAGISRFTEYRASHQFTTANVENGEIIYSVTDAHSVEEEPGVSGSQQEGIFRLIYEEIKKYGAGDYTLKFDAKSVTSPGEMLTCQIVYGLEKEYNDHKIGSDTDRTLSTAWQTVTKTFTVTNDHLAQKNVAIIIYDRDKTLTDFSIKNVTLTKSGNVTAAYTVTWRMDGVDLKEKWIPGVIPQVDFDPCRVEGANPYRVFDRWDQPVVAVTSNAIYTALYLSAGATLYGTQIRTGDHAARFVGRIEDYRLSGLTELGFEISVGNAKADCKVTKVYTSIFASGVPVYADPGHPESNTKFFTYCLMEIPAGTELSVRTYAVVNGQRIVSDAVTFIFTGNDMVLPGLNVRANNEIEDEAAFHSLFDFSVRLTIRETNAVEDEATFHRLFG